MYAVSGRTGAVVALVDYPKSAICLPVVQISLDQCTMHLECVLSRNLDAQFTVIFVHYSTARYTATTVRDTIIILTGHAQTARNALHRSAHSRRLPREVRFVPIIFPSTNKRTAEHYVPGLQFVTVLRSKVEYSFCAI